MKANNIFYILIAVSMITNTSCIKTDDADNEKCGDKYNWSEDVQLSFIKSEIEGDHINLYYEDLTEPINICAEVPVQVEYAVSLSKTNYRGEIARLTGIAYAQLDHREYHLTYNGMEDTYNASASINLKPLFGEQAAWIGLQIMATVYYPQSPNIDSIRQELAKNYPRMDIILDYHSTK
jgi:hypothetical protein